MREAERARIERLIRRFAEHALTRCAPCPRVDSSTSNHPLGDLNMLQKAALAQSLLMRADEVIQ